MLNAERKHILALMMLAQSVGLGILIMFLSNVSKSLIAVQLATALLILPVFFVALNAGRFFHKWLIFFALFIALAVMLVAFHGCDLDGMYRWACIGAIRIHVPAILLPSLLAVFDSCREEQSYWKRVLVFISASGALVAVAFCSDLSYSVGLASGLIAISSYRKRILDLVYWVSLGSCALGLASFRDVSLPPVIHTEGILSAAWAIDSSLGVLAVLSLLIGVGSPLALWNVAKLQKVRAPIVSLTTLLAMIALFGFTGKWPVPFLGFGAGPILGTTLALGLIIARTQNVDT